MFRTAEIFILNVFLLIQTKIKKENNHPPSYIEHLLQYYNLIIINIKQLNMR